MIMRVYVGLSFCRAFSRDRRHAVQSLRSHTRKYWFFVTLWIKNIYILFFTLCMYIYTYTSAEGPNNLTRNTFEDYTLYRCKSISVQLRMPLRGSWIRLVVRVFFSPRISGDNTPASPENVNGFLLFYPEGVVLTPKS